MGEERRPKETGAWSSGNLRLVCDAGVCRVIVVDDHPRSREDVRNILSEGSDLKVVGEAGDGVELLALLEDETLRADLVILDVSMPRLSGLAVAPRVRKMRPDLKILILTVHKEEEYLQQAFHVGAQGYLLKDEADEQLLSAVQALRAGKIFISPSLLEKAPLTPTPR